jgi:hypothetical protein
MYSAGVSAVKYGGALAGKSGNPPAMLESTVSKKVGVSRNGGLSASKVEVRTERWSGFPHCSR